MFWNVTFTYNAFIRTTDHCEVQTAFVSLFYIFINMKPWNASNSSVCCCCCHATTTRAFNEILYKFLRIFLISENSLKFANFSAEVTNSRSMAGGRCSRTGSRRRPTCSAAATKLFDSEWHFLFPVISSHPVYSGPCNSVSYLGHSKNVSWWW